MSQTSTWADVARNKGGTITVPSSNVPRIGALELLIPSGKPDLLKIAQAVEKLCRDPAAWQPFVVGEKVYVQSLVPEKESVDDRKLMLEKGLIVGNTSVKVKETLGDTSNKDLMVGWIDGVTVTSYATAELRREFEKLGNLMHFTPRVFSGTRVKTGTIDFILDVSEKRHGPKRVYWLDNGTSRDPVSATSAVAQITYARNAQRLLSAITVTPGLILLTSARNLRHRVPMLPRLPLMPKDQQWNLRSSNS